MAVTVRRVVTGHDARGRARVLFDDTLTSAPGSRPGHSSRVVWNCPHGVADNEGLADNGGAADAAAREVPTSLAEGSIFRIVEYMPGVAPRNHRTSSLDYAVVLSGSIDMELDDGVSVTLRQGDVLVQRGTVHNWVNRGSEPCRIAFVLIGAKPVLESQG